MAKDTPQPGGIPNRPYQAPQEDPKNPYVPAPKRRDSLKLASLADGEPDSSMMNYVTEKGFFLDGRGRSYMQGGGKFQDAGEYDVDIHGLPVPMASRKSLSIAQFPRISTGEPMTNIEQKQGLEVLKKLEGPQKRKQLKIFMDQYMKGV
tara:strand:+ start:35 stop:481 length:447 start_codon:yes stop_codon:yes gene_type:complete